jgi:hypothetical protein
MSVMALAQYLLQRRTDHLFLDDCENELADVIREHLLDGADEDSVATLTRGYMRNEPDALSKVGELTRTGNVEVFLEFARRRRLDKIVQAYARREEETVKFVDDFLSNVGRNMDVLTIEGLSRNFEKLERIDRLIAIAEGRRNAALREIERHHAALAARVRQSIKQIEDAGFTVLETKPPKAKDAA